jgi:hypothetical protein
LHRGITILIATLAFAAASPGPALGDTDYGVGQPDNDTYLGTRTDAQAAFEAVKLGLVAQIEALPTSGGAIALSINDVSNTSACETACEYDTGAGSTWGTTGFVTPRNRTVLNVRARHQMTVYWCGPASGQVVINYSRGYVYDSLNGDNTATNWKPQATIATWMKTTESQGTLGSNLAAALNRTDAVKKPIPEWSYVYGRNSDAQDLHSKVVADVLYVYDLVERQFRRIAEYDLSTDETVARPSLAGDLLAYMHYLPSGGHYLEWAQLPR